MIATPFSGIVDHLFGHVVERAFGVLVRQSRFGDGPGVFAGRSVEDRGFGGVDIYDGVVHAQRPECRHDVLDGRDAVSAGFDGRAARGIDDMVAQGGDYGLPFDVGAAEHDAGAGFGGIDGHGYFHARMKALARERDRGFQRLLFGRHKREFLVYFAQIY